MNKYFILLFCLFGLSFLYQTSAAAPKECDVFYYDVPAPPVCTWVIGPDGKKYQECTSVGSAAYTATLNAKQKSFTLKSFPLNDLEWSGICKCTLTLYNKTGNKSCYINYPFSNSKAKHVYANKIWKRRTTGFKVACTF